ncbi:hypothetical protein M0Q97_02750 [Candidatus Dojkabacteria bacterium]|jgi:hypothetical protein|nr:hypothetical protein [Candidatus Dojkabacteria bacterium]
MARYIDDDEFYFEIKISLGKGKLTKKSEMMIVKIGEEMIRKFERKYKTPDDKFDCMQQGILMMLQNWVSFNDKKYSSAFPYFSEICKRGIAAGLNTIYQKKNNQESPKMISLNHSNDGKGLHNL